MFNLGGNQINHQSCCGYFVSTKEVDIEHREDEDSLLEHLNN